MRCNAAQYFSEPVAVRALLVGVESLIEPPDRATLRIKTFLSTADEQLTARPLSDVASFEISVDDHVLLRTR